MMYLEAISTIATAIAVVGVVANNRRLRWCFLCWLVSNGLSAAIHVYTGPWSFVVRDVIFLVLAVEGWILWGRNDDKGA